MQKLQIKSSFSLFFIMIDTSFVIETNLVTLTSQTIVKYTLYNIKNILKFLKKIYQVSMFQIIVLVKSKRQRIYR